jgi:hypothetical protein
MTESEMTAIPLGKLSEEDSMSDPGCAARTRRYVVVHESYGVGSYGFRWESTLSVRVDGLRFRYFHRGFRWVGNEGGTHDDERYLTPAEARELWAEEFAAAREESFDEVVAAALARCAAPQFRADHDYCTKVCRGEYFKRDGRCGIQFGVSTPPVPEGRNLAG